MVVLPVTIARELGYVDVWGRNIVSCAVCIFGTSKDEWIRTAWGVVLGVTSAGVDEEVVELFEVLVLDVVDERVDEDEELDDDDVEELVVELDVDEELEEVVELFEVVEDVVELVPFMITTQ